MASLVSILAIVRVVNTSFVSPPAHPGGEKDFVSKKSFYLLQSISILTRQSARLPQKKVAVGPYPHYSGRRLGGKLIHYTQLLSWTSTPAVRAMGPDCIPPTNGLWPMCALGPELRPAPLSPCMGGLDHRHAVSS